MTHPDASPSPRRPLAAVTVITEGVYRALVIEALLVLAALPALLASSLLPAGPLGTALLVLAALPLLPAHAAALHAWSRRGTGGDLTPAADLLRGLRLSTADSLRLGLPALVLLAALTTVASTATSVQRGVLLAAAGVLALLLARGLTILARFRFRTVDVLRLAVHTLLARPLATLALLSLGILTVGSAVLVGAFVPLLCGSLLLLALSRSEAPVVALVEERFVA